MRYNIDKSLQEKVKKATAILNQGGIILYPTDTIWGIGCDATNPEAVKKIYDIKNRNDAKSMIVLAKDMVMVERYVEKVPEIADQLIEITEKPLTIIYPNAINLAKNVIAEDGSIGIRIPNHTFCQQLLYHFRKPLVSTSANLSGIGAPSTLAEISQDIKSAVDWIADSKYENESSRKASSIIKLSISGEVKIIRE
ncbi:MAG: L-threonylcarbamoyladenylate synthase [Bacteroidales bacterium]